jgi:hypothetical protein
MCEVEVVFYIYLIFWVIDILEFKISLAGTG